MNITIILTLTTFLNYDIQPSSIMTMLGSLTLSNNTINVTASLHPVEVPTGQESDIISHIISK